MINADEVLAKHKDHAGKNKQSIFKIKHDHFYRNPRHESTHSQWLKEKDRSIRHDSEGPFLEYVELFVLARLWSPQQIPQVSLIQVRGLTIYFCIF